MAKGKRMRKAVDGLDRAANYALEEAVKMIKARAGAKFDETVEIAMNLNVDPRHADQNVRAFIGAINRAKPSGAKGTYVKRISLSSTMGPGVKIDVASVAAPQQG